MYVHVYTCACMCTFTYGAKTVLSTQQASALLQAQKPNHHSQQSAWRINQTQLTSATYVDFVHVSSVHMCVWAHVCMWSQASTLGIFLGCTLPYVFNKPGTHQFGNTSWQVSSRGPPHSSPLVLVSQGSWNLTTGPHAYIVHTAPNELSSRPSTLQYLKGFLCFYFYILNQHWL